LLISNFIALNPYGTLSVLSKNVSYFFFRNTKTSSVRILMLFTIIFVRRSKGKEPPGTWWSSPVGETRLGTKGDEEKRKEMKRRRYV
jgi:hypothetical protein